MPITFNADEIFEMAEEIERLPAPDLIIDAIIGYGLTGAPSGPAADLIRWADAQQTSILSLDVPSGLESGSGEVHDCSICATATMTLALPKEGLRTPAAKAVTGELYLSDISVPPDLYAGLQLGLDVGPVFARQDIIRLS